MSYKLVKFEKDWADEFSVYGMRLMSDSEYDEYIAEAKKASYPVERCFGSNPGNVVWFDSFEQVMDSFDVACLSTQAAQTISDKIGDNFGWFPDDIGDY